MKTEQATHEWKRVPTDWFKSLPPEARKQIEEQDEEDTRDYVMNLICGPFPGGFQDGLGRIAEFQSYFPGNNKLDEEGNWILVKEPPPTEFTVPPLSIWYAMPWPMDGYACKAEGRRRRRGEKTEHHQIHRVKVMTLRGALGLFPHEYSRIDDVSKYLEFIGQGMEIKFFGGLDGVPKDALFYIRSRGISKTDAIKMLLGNIRAPEVCWLETGKEVTAAFGYIWPDESRLATGRA